MVVYDGNVVELGVADGGAADEEDIAARAINDMQKLKASPRDETANRFLIR